MKTALPKHYWFYDQLYLFNFRLVWPVTAETLERYVLDELGHVFHVRDKGFGAKALYFPTTEGKRGTYLMALTEWSGNAHDHSNMTHEAIHLAGIILSHRGVRVSASNDEALTYLSAYIVRQCLNVLLPKHLRVIVDPAAKPNPIYGKRSSRCRV